MVVGILRCALSAGARISGGPRFVSPITGGTAYAVACASGDTRQATGTCMVQAPRGSALSEPRIGQAAESCEGRACARPACPFGKETDGSWCGGRVQTVARAVSSTGWGGPSFASPDGTGMEARQRLTRRQDAIEMGERGGRRSAPLSQRSRDKFSVFGTMSSCHDEFQRPIVPPVPPVPPMECAPQPGTSMDGPFLRRANVEVEASAAKESFEVGRDRVKVGVVHGKRGTHSFRRCTASRDVEEKKKSPLGAH